MAIQRYTTATPTSGLSSYPTSVITPRRFLSVFFDKQSKSSTFDITDEQLAVNTITTGKFRLDYVPKGAPGDQISGESVLEIWSGPSKTGTQFSAIKADADFGAASAREFRYYLNDDAIDIDPDQITDGGFTTLYATYKAAYSKTNPEWRGTIEQHIEAIEDAVDALGGGSGSDAGSFQATAGEGLDEGTVYIDPSDSAVYQHDDPSSLIQSSSVGWVTTSYSTGATVTVYYRGKVSKPSALSSVPIGKDIYAGKNNRPTWDNDSTTANQLASGDYRAYLGRSYDGSNIWLNCNVPVEGVEA